MMFVQKQAEMLEFLAEFGPQSTAALHDIFGRDVAFNGFRQRMQRMQRNGLVENTEGLNRAAKWVVFQACAKPVPKLSAPALPAAPRQYDLMRAPLLVATEMQPARPGAATHTQYASRRGDDLVPHMAPIHMCSGLKGGMQ